MSSKMKSVDIREFVVAWQASDSINDVKKLLGIDEVDNSVVSTKATQLRTKGVKMKRMRQPNRYDYDLLNGLAEFAAAESQNGPVQNPKDLVLRYLGKRASEAS